MAENSMTRDDVIRSTAAHIRRVGTLLVECSSALNQRAVDHDASKWSPEEWPAFEAATPQLAGLTYGSDAYKAALASIQPALQHHYAANGHHPEHHACGINGMTLLDLIEMLCDWKAATERHNDGSVMRSLDHNRARFEIGPQLEAILRNTAEALGWIPACDAVEQHVDRREREAAMIAEGQEIEVEERHAAQGGA